MHEFIHSRLTLLSRGLRKTFLRARDWDRQRLARRFGFAALIPCFFPLLKISAALGPSGQRAEARPFWRTAWPSASTPESNGYVVELGGGTGPVNRRAL